jgi:hypothetical protein
MHEPFELMEEAEMASKRISRRSLLKGLPIVAGVTAAAGTMVMGDMASAQTKLTHKAAKYQDKPHNSQQCATCLQFEPPNACKIVQSPITPNGWCQFYAKKT